MAKKKPSEPDPEEARSDFKDKPEPQAPKGAPASLPRTYLWRGWTIAEYASKVEGEKGHLLFRRKERADAFVDLIRRGESKATIRLALGRMRPDWKAVEDSREE